MTLAVYQLHPAKGATKKRKRVGRGNASGHGTYSTRGQKGQRSRSGVSGLKRLGMRQVLLRTPKKKGFKSFYIKDQVVNINEINVNFKDGEVVDPKALLQKKLVKTAKTDIKILGQGDLKLKNLTFRKVKFSTSAEEKAKASGAKIEK